MKIKERGVIFSVLAELTSIGKDVAIGIMKIPFAPPPSKPRWCKCAKCGAWHPLAP